MRENAGGFAAAGLAVGAFVGSRRPAERWQRVELPSYRYSVRQGPGLAPARCPS